MDSNESQLVLLFISGTAIILLVAFVITLFVVFHQKRIAQEQIKLQNVEMDYQKKMLQAALQSQESERRRVSKDLHDDVGMMLMTMRVNLNNQPSGPVTELRQMVDETHESIRRISWDLMPSTLDNFGLVQSTQEMCERLSSMSTVVISQKEEGHRYTLDKDQELLLYRIVQEAVTNSLKHSYASQIDLHYKWADDNLLLTIADNGSGFDFPTMRKKTSGRHGLGLFNLENRVSLLGADLHFKKNEPSGSIVSIALPITTPHT